MEYDAFEDFLIGYVVAGHTVDDNVMEELNKLTDEFIKHLYSDYLFTEIGISAYIEFLDERLTDDNRHWFPLRFDKDRYIDHLEKWIRYRLKIE